MQLLLYSADFAASSTTLVVISNARVVTLLLLLQLSPLLFLAEKTLSERQAKTARYLCAQENGDVK